MTREEITALAREAGLGEHTNYEYEQIWELKNVEALERFAAIVIAAERERCAKIVEQYTGAWNDEGFALAAKIRKGE